MISFRFTHCSFRLHFNSRFIPFSEWRSELVKWMAPFGLQRFINFNQFQSFTRRNDEIWWNSMRAVTCHSVQFNSIKLISLILFHWMNFMEWRYMVPSLHSWIKSIQLLSIQLIEWIEWFHLHSFHLPFHYIVPLSFASTSLASLTVSFHYINSVNLH